MALINKLNAIGDAIRTKTGKTELIPLADMPAEIAAIETGGGGGEELPEEAFVIDGDCAYRFANGGWDWFIEKYGNKITTKGIFDCSYMFRKINLKQIPFEINCATTSEVPADYMFSNSTSLESLPKINNLKPSKIGYFLYYCSNLTYIPDDFVSNWDFGIYNSSGGTTSNIFNGCNRLRYIPENFLKHLHTTGTATTTVPYNYQFSNCHVLDEIKSLGVQLSTLSSNRMTSMIDDCSRLKRFTFNVNDDGTPKTVKWKSQTLDFTYVVGYARNRDLSEFDMSSDTEVTDNATYQALKDNPDWWTKNLAYSRYNHDSAVETINSLPDSSAYGTNTIKFKGEAGSATDGGAINTLTAEEIAVATAKGWTVTFA